MIIQSIKTRLMLPPKDDLYAVLKESLSELKEHTVVAISSKVVSIGEGRCIPLEEVEDKDDLIRHEADRYLPRELITDGWVMHTLTNNLFMPAAGIDESNASGHYILWPKDPKASAKEIHTWLCETYGVKEIGVLIVDSHSVPLRRGVVGISLAHHGFQPINDYRGTRDLFGRELKVSQANIADGLAAAAVVCEGEGNEQTPIALISDIPFVQFGDEREANLPFSSFEVAPEEDIYIQLLKDLPWQDGDT